MTLRGTFLWLDNKYWHSIGGASPDLFFVEFIYGINNSLNKQEFIHQPHIANKIASVHSFHMLHLNKTYELPVK